MVGAVVSNITFIYATASQNRIEMMEQVERLDNNWQERIVEVVREVKEDLDDVKSEVKEVRKSIPPDWFRKMVEKNQRDIEELRKQLLSVKEEP